MKELLATFDHWSNDACIGYTIKAMEHAGCKPAMIKKIVSQLRLEFGNTTVSGAETHYIESEF